MKDYKDRLKRIEDKVKIANYGVFDFTFKDGRKERMFYTDAINDVLDEKVVSIDGDENDNILGLLRALML